MVSSISGSREIMKSLNHIYRTIWSEALGAWVAVSEITKAKGKRSVSSVLRAIRLASVAIFGGSERGARLKPVLFAIACCFVLNARANPNGGVVVNGNASFNTSGSTLTVTNTPGTIINWQGFSINANEVTRFAQQNAASTVLNRVVTNNPSAILGTLSSNGRVFLVNANGIMFGAGSTVDVAGLVATTLNLSDADFLAGRYNFTNVPGAQNISNAGNINAQQGGQIYLIAPNVENSGIINAPNGEILLVAGHEVQLVNSNDPNLRVNITAPAGDVTNIGQLIASSGTLGLFGTVVRNSGTVSADSATTQGGKIVFRASQRVDAGGTVSAKGAGGGEIKVLSDMQSGTVNVTGTLDASAPNSGDGGFIETSAADVRIADSANVTTRAANGKNGTWLIDPADFVIASSGGNISGSLLANMLSLNSVTIHTGTGSDSGTDLYGTAGTNGDIFVNDAVSWGSNLLTLRAWRNIIFNANLNGSGSAQLALEYGQGAVAAGNTSFYQFNSGSKIYLPAGDNFFTKQGSDGSTIGYHVITSLGTLGSTQTTELQGMEGALAANYVLGDDIDASSTNAWGYFSENGGGYAGFKPIGYQSNYFTGRFDGLGHTISNIHINQSSNTSVPFVGLFGITSGALIQNVTLSGGSVNASAPYTYYVGGLVGSSMGGAIRSAFVTGLSVSCSVGSCGLVGGLVGENDGATIYNSVFYGGTVSGTNQVGGLVGYNYGGGLISGSSAAINSTVTGNQYVGGLVGTNTGTIDGSYATDNTVSGSTQIGGLAGTNTSGTMSNSYVSGGSVTGTRAVCGLACNNTGGSVLNSHYSIDGANALTINGGNYVTRGGLYDAQFQDWYNNGLSLNIANYTSLTHVSGFSYSINSVQGMKDLLGFADNGAFNFTLAGNIDLVSASGLYIPYLSANFNGAGHTITNLHIDQPFNGSLGLFGDIPLGVTVNNLILQDSFVRGANIVGTLAGSNEGTVDNVRSNNVAVQRGVLNGAAEFGGLVGENSGTISNSVVSAGYVGYAAVAIYQVGGLVGRNTGTISTSHVLNADVAGSSSVGGLVGYNDGGSITSSYVSGGYVSGSSSYIGGLVGYNNGGSITGSWVSGGTVSGADYIGGLVGYNYYGYIDSSFVDTGSSSQGYQYVGGLVGFNLAGSIGNGSHVSDSTVTGSRYVGGLVGTNNGDGGEGGPYYATIDNSIVNNTLVTAGRDVGGLVGTTNQWSDISNSHVTGSSVSSISSGAANAGGLVGYNQGSISSSYVDTGDVTSVDSGEGNYTNGGLVGYNQNGPISDSYVLNTIVHGQSSIGGLVGWNSGATISNSYVSGGSVSGAGRYVGGLVGYNDNGTINTNSHVSGVAVSGSGSYVGGLAGYNYFGTIDSTYVTGGSVSGYDSVGGLVGYSDYNSTISNSFVSGVTNISGNQYVGGLVGYSYNTDINNTYVVASNISGVSSVGGLVGYLDGGEGGLSYSYVSGGSVTGTTNVGGVAGYNYNANVNGTFWDTALAGGSLTHGVGYDFGAGGGSDNGTTGLVSNGLMTMANYSAAGWDIADTGSAGSVWRIYDDATGQGYTTPLLTSFLKPLLITSGAQSKTYDGSTFSGGLLSPTYNPAGPDLAHVFGNANAYGANAINAGTYAPALYSDQLGYDISYSGGTLTVNTATVSLTIGANNGSKTYGTTLVFNGTEFTPVGLFGGDTISSVTLTSTGAVNTAGVGTYSIVVTPGSENWTQGSASNYTITYTPGTLTVNPYALTVTANTAGKIYGNVDPALTYGTSGMLFSDVLTGSQVRVAGENVGNYAINQGTLANPNYTITYVPANLTIGARNITITVNPASKTYGQADNLTFSVGGLGLGFSDTNASVSSAVTRTAGENVGTYSITAGTLTNANYNVTGFTGNTLTISPALLTIIANALYKFEDTSDPALTYIANGLQFSDTTATTLTGSLVRDPGEDVGTYGINQGSLALTLFGSTNYNMTFVPGTFYVLKVPPITPPVLSELVLTTTPDDDHKRKDNDVVADNGSGTTPGVPPSTLPVCPH